MLSLQNKLDRKEASHKHYKSNVTIVTGSFRIAGVGCNVLSDLRTQGCRSFVHHDDFSAQVFGLEELRG